MTNLLVNALLAIVVVAVVWFVASMLLPGQIAILLTVIVAVLALVYLLRGNLQP